jgi:hypothetical protein
MKRLDENKTSLVDFLRSINFSRRQNSKRYADFPEHFAGFSPQTGDPETRTAKKSKKENHHPIRSAN